MGYNKTKKSYGKLGTLCKSGGECRIKDSGAKWDKIFTAFYMWYAETSPTAPYRIIVSIVGQKESSQTYSEPKT